MKNVLMIENNESPSFVELCTIMKRNILNNNCRLHTVDKGNCENLNIDLLNHMDCVFAYSEMKYIREICDKNGIKIIPNTVFTNRASNKFVQYKLLTDNHILTPITYKYTDIKTNDLDLINNFKNKFVLKSAESYGGYDVHLIESEHSFNEILRTYENELDLLIIQEYLEDAKGFDFRVLMIDHVPITTIKREQKNSDEFRSNVSQGGQVIYMDPIREVDELCIKVSQIFNADICGIDILYSKGKYYVCEINTIPGISYKNSDEIANLIIRSVI